MPCPALPPLPPRPRLQFCLLEPELLCRLVWVKDVEHLPSSGGASGPGGGSQQQQKQKQQDGPAAAGAAAGEDPRLRAPAGTTELVSLLPMLLWHGLRLAP